MFYRKVFRKGMKVFGFTAPVAIAADDDELRPLLLLLHWDDRIQKNSVLQNRYPLPSLLRNARDYPKENTIVNLWCRGLASVNYFIQSGVSPP